MKSDYRGLSVRLGVVNVYLHAFFKELERLTQWDETCVSNAIANDDGTLCVLISAGDIRVKVPFENFGADPAQAAFDVFTKFKSMSDDEIQNAAEEVR